MMPTQESQQEEEYEEEESQSQELPEEDHHSDDTYMPDARQEEDEYVEDSLIERDTSVADEREREDTFRAETRSEAGTEDSYGPGQQLAQELDSGSSMMFTAPERVDSQKTTHTSFASTAKGTDYNPWAFRESSQASVFITDFPSNNSQRSIGPSDVEDFTLSFVDESTNLGFGHPPPVRAAPKSLVRARHSSPELGDGSSIYQGKSTLRTSTPDVSKERLATRNRLQRRGIELSPSVTPTPSPSIPSFIDSTGEPQEQESPCNTSTESAILQSTQEISRLSIPATDRYKSLSMPIRESSAFTHISMPNESRLVQKPQEEFNILKLFKDRSVDELEEGVKKGIKVLDRLEELVASNTDASSARDVETLRNKIEKVRAEAKVGQTIIGVMGDTGAGKSSVINALLGEERIVPTNCIRACTAVVTEISYNYETPDKYRAVVEFVGREDWYKELQVMFTVLIDHKGLSSNVGRQDSDAGIAMARLKAVYPQ